MRRLPARTRSNTAAAGRWAGRGPAARDQLLQVRAGQRAGDARRLGQGRTRQSASRRAGSGASARGACRPSAGHRGQVSVRVHASTLTPGQSNGDLTVSALGSMSWLARRLQEEPSRLDADRVRDVRGRLGRQPVLADAHRLPARAQADRGEVAGLFLVYALTLIPGLLIGGPASDRFGRRRWSGPSWRCPRWPRCCWCSGLGHWP
jgi:hypothetical protein